MDKEIIIEALKVYNQQLWKQINDYGKVNNGIQEALLKVADQVHDVLQRAEKKDSTIIIKLKGSPLSKANKALNGRKQKTGKGRQS